MATGRARYKKKKNNVKRPPSMAWENIIGIQVGTPSGAIRYGHALSVGVVAENVIGIVSLEPA